METPGLKVRRSNRKQGEGMFPQNTWEKWTERCHNKDWLRGDRTGWVTWGESWSPDLAWKSYGPGWFPKRALSPLPFLSYPVPLAPRGSSVKPGFQKRMCCPHQHSPRRSSPPCRPGCVLTEFQGAFLHGIQHQALWGSEAFQVSSDPLKCSPQGSISKLLSEKCGIIWPHPWRLFQGHLTFQEKSKYISTNLSFPFSSGSVIHTICLEASFLSSKHGKILAPLARSPYTPKGSQSNPFFSMLQY